MGSIKVQTKQHNVDRACCRALDHLINYKAWGPFLESPENVSGPKTFITLRSAYSVRLVFSYVVQGIKIIIYEYYVKYGHTN